jgi:hypothetical protein
MEIILGLVLINSGLFTSKYFIMKKIFLIIAFIINVHNCQSQEKYLIAKTDSLGRKGFVDINCSTVIPFGKYDRIFTDTLYHFAIVDYGAQGIIAIDINDNKLFNLYIIGNGPDSFSEGKVRITNSGLLGFADSNGAIVVTPQFKYAYPFKRGIAPVCLKCTFVKDSLVNDYTIIKNVLWGIINDEGEYLFQPQFDSISVDTERNQYLFYKNNDKYFLDADFSLIHDSE